MPKHRMKIPFRFVYDAPFGSQRIHLRHTQEQLREGEGMSDIGAMQRAARAGDIETVKALLAEGVSIHDGANEHGTALHWAVAWGRETLVEFLLEQGADAGVSDDEGLTPLHLAAKKGYTETCVLERLIKANGNAVNMKADDGVTPLHHAANRGRADFVRILLAAGADAGATNDAGETPLDLARRRRHIEVMEVLKTHGHR